MGLMFKYKHLNLITGIVSSLFCYNRFLIDFYCALLQVF